MNKTFNFIEQAKEKIVYLSDGCAIRTLHLDGFQSKKRFTLLLIAGWGSVDETWNSIVEKNLKYFNLVYLETREKYSSILKPNTIHDLNRLSQDIKEVMNSYQLKENNLILYGSSWASIIVAHGLSEEKYDPFLSVLLGPMIKLPTPFYAKYWYHLIPVSLFKAVKKIVKIWLLKAKSDNEEQSRRYLKVLEKSDFKKFKLIGKHVARKKFLPLYKGIKSNTIVIVASEDKMHKIDESLLIAKNIPHCTLVDMKFVRDFDSDMVIDVIKTEVDKMILNQ